MTELIGISGSPRAGSVNSALLRYAQAVMPHGATLNIASIAEIPPAIRALDMRPWFGRTLFVPHAVSVFDSEGNILDEALAKRVARFMEVDVDFIKNNTPQYTRGPMES
jgi:hypothetical protein